MRKQASEPILKTLAEDEDGTYISLCEDGRCPHLTECGLCRIISEHGDDYVSEICREHPRFYQTTGTRREVGLGAVCEEAARLITTSSDYAEFVKVGDVELYGSDSDFDAISERDIVYECLSDASTSYTDRLLKISERYGVSIEKAAPMLCEVLADLEYLDSGNRALFLNFSPSYKQGKGHESALERFFAYLVFRHASSACSLSEFRTGIGFALFLERLAASLLDLGELGAPEVVRMISEEIEYSEENTESIMLEFEFMEA
jgi:lysine-N-methylase